MLNKEDLQSYSCKCEWKIRGNINMSYDNYAMKIIKERKKRKIIANLKDSRYEIVNQCVKEAGFTIILDDDISDAYLIWSDNFLPLEKILKLKSYQRANHFPGMVEISRKDLLTKNFSRMQKVEPDEYNFMPNTWILPRDSTYFLNYARKLCRQDSDACFIQKPANGAMGHGIHLYRNVNKIPLNVNNGVVSVLQEYIKNPLLIDGYKCDLRVYVLITSCDPLRTFVYNDGLVRLSAEKYVKLNEPNGDSIYRQLTNYTVNKHHSQYNRSTDEEVSSKRSFTFFNNYIRNVKKSDPFIIWDKIYDLIIKTIIIALPHLVHSYRISSYHKSNQSIYMKTNDQSSMNDVKQFFVNTNDNNNTQTTSQTSTLTRSTSLTPTSLLSSKTTMNKSASSNPSICCFLPKTPFTVNSNLFEILGFDILLDDQLNPWLIEVNRSPSFNTDQELDKRVKYGLLTDTIRLLNIRPSDKFHTERQLKITTRKRLYNSQSTQTQNWMKNKLNLTKNGNINKNSIHYQKSANSKTNQSVFPNHSRRDYLTSIIDKHQLEGTKLSWKIDRLRQQLLMIRQQLSLEFYEHHNSGNWHRIFPSNNSTLQKKYGSLIMTSFEQFLHGNQNCLFNEMRTTYLNPITEDDIYNHLSKLIKQESKLKPGINIDEIWSQYVDNYNTSYRDFDDDDADSNDEDVYTEHNGNCITSYTKHNDNFKNLVQSSMNTKTQTKSVLTSISPTNSTYFDKTNLKSISAPVSPSLLFLNERNCKAIKQTTDKLSIDNKYKSLNIERNSKQLRKCVQTLPYSTTDYDDKNKNLTVVSPFSAIQNNDYNAQVANNDDAGPQNSVEYISSMNRQLPHTTELENKKTDNERSIANIQLGNHNINILLDFNHQSNSLHNFKLSTDYLHQQFIPKQTCFLPIIHWNYCTLNEILPLFNKKLHQFNIIHKQLIQYLKQFQNMIKNQMNLMNYYSCINLLANKISNITIYQNRLEQLNYNTLDKEEILYYYNIQCFNQKQFIIHQNDELLQTLIMNCLNSMKLMQIQIKLEGENLFNEEISKQFEKGLIHRFIHGLRITRILNRIKSRLLINHGHLLRSIIQMIPNVTILNEAILKLPMKYLLTEPLLNAEELCCKHFIRLCIESFILNYLQYLDDLMKTTNNDNNLHFQEIP
ncbi:Tubulin polyglutamylase TTLL7 [Schistosoma japonicum]|nr:Tubulin polyglutamylase TTLL7 [Schistosoma japonicum]